MADVGDRDNGTESVPQWKRELILRRRANFSGTKQLSGECGCSEALGCAAAGHQPSSTSCSLANAFVNSGSSAFLPCNTCSLVRSSGLKMVQERAWTENKQISVDMVEKNDSDSSSSEELQYGPGIVSKLKNRYLSLTLREQNARTRPSILPMRKATSLENLLDDDGDDHHAGEDNRMFESRTVKNGSNGNAKNVPNRYRNAARGSDMKRARSVETISRMDVQAAECRPKRESMHEDVFIIKEGSDKPHNRKTNVDNIAENNVFSANNVVHVRINRPKKIAPVMNEKEKPPADVVKQTKKIFESRPEMRTRTPQITGEVAAKVASFKSIIIQTKVNKPPVKQKPEKIRKPAKLPVKSAWRDSVSPDLTSPLTTESKRITSPDVAPLQSPIPDISSSDSESNRKNTLSETPDLILHSSPAHKPLINTTADFITAEINHSTITHHHEPEINPKTQPLKLEINGTAKIAKPAKPPKQPAPSPPKQSPPNPPSVLIVKHDPVPVLNVKQQCPAVPLSPREIEKNFINKELHQQQQQQIAKPESGVVPIKKRTSGRVKHEEQNCVVFKFTDRKDVPDYIGNDGTVRTAKIELPKAGEGGITILPGAAISDEFADYEEELRSLEGPPSPCDVDFINDNILIDGRSSLSQKTKKSKMRIQFVEAVPQIFEYPSEASMLLLEDVQQSSSPSPSPSLPAGVIAASSMGHAVPSLSGSSLANYTPKSGYSDDFELGVTKTLAPAIPEPKQTEPEAEPEEVEEPVLFSAGNNADILF